MRQSAGHQNMIKHQVELVPVRDSRLAMHMRCVPREHFLPSPCLGIGSVDAPFHLPESGIALTPREAGIVLDALCIQSHEVVLEIGTEAGYMTALLSYFADYVYSVDSSTRVTQRAARKLSELGRDNVTLVTGHGLNGWRTRDTYDVILINGSLPALPRKLCEQLVIGGRLFVVVGHTPCMRAMYVTRYGQSDWQQQCLFETDKPRVKSVKPGSTFTF